MISVRDLKKAFGPKVVLDGVSLEIEKGEILAIMGTSGGGKTTLLKCVAGLLAPDSGEVLVDGVDVGRDPDAARRKMGLVFQSSALFDYLSVAENVLFGARRWMSQTHKEESELLAEMLSSVDLRDSACLLPSELSGGMKKRVGIARALAMRPEVMLYDEPTTGLDPVTGYSIDKLIVDVSKRFQVTSVVVSHDVTSVFRVASRIAFLRAGKLEFVGDVPAFQSSRSLAIRELLHKSETDRLTDEPIRE